MSTPPNVLTAAQCRAARVMVEWSTEQLSESSGIGLQTILDFEARIRRPDPETKRCLRIALEHAGVTFITENGGGAGVRFKFNSRDVRAIDRWEAEGGTAGEDDVS
jgi:hypothetical protein